MDFNFTDEQNDIARAAREFAEKQFTDRAEEFDRDETFDEAIFRKAAELGFVGIFIDEEYEGSGMGISEQCILQEEFAAVDLGIGVSVLSPSFGSEVIQAFGTEDQKKKYLPPIATGKAIMGSAFTEPDAGSDLAAASTTAVKDGDEYILNGSKIFITNGTRADYLICFVQTDPENKNIHRRHSMVMVETDRDGIDRNKLRGKLGIRASDTAEISFNNVRVPCANLVGESGNGFAEAMYCFNFNRIGIAAQAIGLSRSALNESIRYVKKRITFGSPLSSYQSIQFKIADMHTWIHAGKNLVYEAAWKIDNGITDHRLIATAKAFCGQMAVKCSDMALQMHGGYGYMSEYKVQRIYRDAKILELYEGTTEIEKLIIARSLLG